MNVNIMSKTSIMSIVDLKYIITETTYNITGDLNRYCSSFKQSRNDISL